MFRRFDDAGLAGFGGGAAIVPQAWRRDGSEKSPAWCAGLSWVSLCAGRDQASWTAESSQPPPRERMKVHNSVRSNGSLSPSTTWPVARWVV